MRWLEVAALELDTLGSARVGADLSRYVIVTLPSNKTSDVCYYPNINRARHFISSVSLYKDPQSSELD